MLFRFVKMKIPLVHLLLGQSTWVLLPLKKRLRSFLIRENLFLIRHLTFLISQNSDFFFKVYKLSHFTLVFKYGVAARQCGYEDPTAHREAH